MKRRWIQDSLVRADWGIDPYLGWATIDIGDEAPSGAVPNARFDRGRVIVVDRADRTLLDLGGFTTGAVAQVVTAGVHPGLWIKPLAADGALPTPRIFDSNGAMSPFWTRPGLHWRCRPSATRWSESPIRTRCPGSRSRNGFGLGSSAAACGCLAASCSRRRIERRNDSALARRPCAWRCPCRPPNSYPPAVRRSCAARRSLECAPQRRNPIVKLNSTGGSLSRMPVVQSASIRSTARRAPAATAGSIVISYVSVSSAWRIFGSVIRFICGHRLHGRTNSMSG